MGLKLSESEIKQRLQQLRNVTKLHAAARTQVSKLKALLLEKDTQLARKDARITELETLLLNKESQRKELAGNLWKAKKDRQADARGDAPKPGAQPGHSASRRPTPAPETVSDRQIFDLSVCPACNHQVGEGVDSVEKYQEDIDLAPRNKIVRHYTITRHWCPNCQE